MIGIQIKLPGFCLLLDFNQVSPILLLLAYHLCYSSWRFVVEFSVDSVELS